MWSHHLYGSVTGSQRVGMSHLEERINDLNPLSVLNRGYSITRKLPENLIMKDVAGVKKGDRVHVTLAEGELECEIEKSAPGKRRR